MPESLRHRFANAPTLKKIQTLTTAIFTSLIAFTVYRFTARTESTGSAGLMVRMFSAG